MSLTVSVGIAAYNEGKNIGNLLESLEHQAFRDFDMRQIVVVSSACHDDTESITESYAKDDSRIQIIRQSERKGKASAINLFLERAVGDVCVLVSADTILQNEHCLQRLCFPLLDQRVGISGGHPLPTNDNLTFMGFVSHLVWEIAHQLSLIHPKVGELIAFRNVIERIPENTAVDEARIEMEMTRIGYSSTYVSEALVYNKGPATLSDFLKQRRRIYAGHLHLQATTGFRVSSLSTLRLLHITLGMLRPSWRSISWTAAAMGLEAYARLLGYYDYYIAKKNYNVWEMASSTKRLL